MTRYIEIDVVICKHARQEHKGLPASIQTIGTDFEMMLCNRAMTCFAVDVNAMAQETQLIINIDPINWVGSTLIVGIIVVCLSDTSYS